MSEIKKLLKEKHNALSHKQYKEAASACNAIGREYLSQEKYDDALEQHLEELEYCEITGDQLGIAVANRWIGECYTLLSNFKKALIHIRKFYDISVSLKSVVEEQRAWATFGRTYYLKYQHELASGSGNKESLSKTLDQAELAYYKALKLLYTLGSEIKPIELAEMKCRLLLNLGLVCEIRGDYKQSSKYVQQGLDIALENSLYEDIHRCGYALGTFYQKVGKYNEAEEVLKKALKAVEKLHNKNLICEVQLSKGITLISLEKYDEAKNCLKSAFKMHSSNDEDHEKVVKSLKVCIGVHNLSKNLKTCENSNERKLLLEKIADGLSSIGCYKLAIKKYFECLDSMQDDSPSQKAPIYYSLAQTYLDDGNIPKALEYFEEEYNCQMEKPLEQIETLWKMIEVLEEEGNIDKCEEFYLKAVSIAENANDQRLIHSSLSKLLSFYKSANKIDQAHDVKIKLDSIKYECLSEDEHDKGEGSQDPFSDIHLSELSDSDVNEEEIVSTTRKRGKKVEAKVNEKGETPLHQACINGNLTMVKRLVNNGHSVNVRDYAGWTPLHEACNYGFYEIVEFLLENGADINDPGGPACKGITALHDAASCGNFDVIQLLISRGASVTVVDENGETPLDALLQWKRRTVGELDHVTLKQCKLIEDELRSKMADAGFSTDKKNSEDVNMSYSSDEGNQNIRQGEKRNRSPSLSSDSDSSEEEIISILPYPDINVDQDWDDADGAKAEYKSVMENLRRSAVAASPIKSKPPNTINGPSLLNENEIVNEWLIKDTNEIPKTKRKKRRMNKLNVRTSKRIDNYLIPSPDPVNEKENRNNIVIDEDSNVSVASVSSVDKNTKDCPAQCLKAENSKVTFSLRVHIADKLILVPIPDDNCTVSWLMQEAASRFQSLDGSKPHLTLTKNGALLSDSDLVKNIFSNNEEVFSSVEMWDEPSLEDKYVQICDKRNVTVLLSVRKRLDCFKTSSELNFSNCLISNSHLSIIFCTLLNYKSLQHLNLSGTALNNSNMKELTACIPNFSVLETLNLSCCCLTTQIIKVLIDYLKNHISQSVVLPALKVLDLSYNSFSSSSSLVTFLKLNSLVHLNLASCGLNSTFFLNEMINAIQEKQNLEEFDISGNDLGGTGISDLLFCLPRKSLKKLNLRHTVGGEITLGIKLQAFFAERLPFLTELSLQGCYLTDTDVHQISQCLQRCPQLQVCDFSANPALSSYSLLNFINTAYENNLNITEFNMIGTCVWHDYDLYSLTDFLKFKTLKHLCFDNCPENVAEKLMQLWSDKWENRSLCFNYSFYELSVK